MVLRLTIYIASFQESLFFQVYSDKNMFFFYYNTETSMRYYLTIEKRITAYANKYGRTSLIENGFHFYEIALRIKITKLGLEGLEPIYFPLHLCEK